LILAFNLLSALGDSVINNLDLHGETEIIRGFLVPPE